MAGKDTDIVFKKETVNRLLIQFFKNNKTKVSNDAISLMTDMLKIFVVEATRRAMKQGENEDCSAVDLEHVEKVLPQLLLDF